MGNKTRRMPSRRLSQRRSAVLRRRAKKLQQQKSIQSEFSSINTQPFTKKEIKVERMETGHTERIDATNILYFYENEINNESTQTEFHAENTKKSIFQDSSYQESELVDVQYYIEELQEQLDSKSTIECIIENEMQFRWMEAVYGTKKEGAILYNSTKQEIIPTINIKYNIEELQKKIGVATINFTNSIENTTSFLCKNETNEKRITNVDSSLYDLMIDRFLERNIVLVSNGVTFFLTDSIFQKVNISKE